MTAGRKVALALFDATNPADAVVFAVWSNSARRQREAVHLELDGDGRRGAPVGDET